MIKKLPKRKTFYLSYDGMTDPLGQSQVIPYLKYLSKEFEIHLFSFEKPNNKDLVYKIKSILKNNNIIWTPITYTKSPPIFSKIYDILKFFLIKLIISRYGKPGFTITISAPSLISKATSLKASLLFLKSI